MSNAYFIEWRIEKEKDTTLVNIIDILRRNHQSIRQKEKEHTGAFE